MAAQGLMFTKVTVKEFQYLFQILWETNQIAIQVFTHDH